VTTRDRYRATTAAILLILGIIVVVRGVTDPMAWPFALFGLVLLGLGLYRLNQVRVYLQSVRR